MKFKIFVVLLLICFLFTSLKKENTIADSFIHNAQEELPSLLDYQNINEDIVMLIKFTDGITTRVIPVVYKEGNSQYYFRRSIYHEYDSMGTAYIDNQCTVLSQNLIINGHSSKTKDLQFTFLKSFKEKVYFDNNPSFNIITEDNIFEYTIISFAEYDLESECYTGWYNSSFRTEKDLRNMLKMTEPYCIQKREANIYGNTLITLITCNMEKENSRYVLMAVKN